MSCQQKVARLRASLAYVHDSSNLLGEVLQRFKSRSIRLLTYQVRDREWEFVVPQHEVNHVCNVFKEVGLEETHEYFAALISLIGCDETTVSSLDPIELKQWTEEPVYMSQHTSHMLTQREDISTLMGEVMSQLPVNRAR